MCPIGPDAACKREKERRGRGTVKIFPFTLRPLSIAEPCSRDLIKSELVTLSILMVLAVAAAAQIST